MYWFLEYHVEVKISKLDKDLIKFLPVLFSLKF